MTVKELTTLLTEVNENTELKIGFCDEEGLLTMDITTVITEYDVDSGVNRITLVNGDK